MKKMLMISKAGALKIILDHGWTPNQQTACLKGEYVESGTSFYEIFGNKDFYNKRAIMEWLGY